MRRSIAAPTITVPSRRSTSLLPLNVSSESATNIASATPPPSQDDRTLTRLQSLILLEPKEDIVPLPSSTPRSTSSVSVVEVPEGAEICEDAPNTDSFPSAKTSAALPSSLQAEYKLSELQVLGVVGRGSGGVVHRALHIPTSRILAMKVIPFGANDKVRQQLLLELRTLYEAECPFIVRYYGAFFKEGSISILMEYMNAGSVAELMSREKTGMPEHLIRSIARQVLQGLRYLHKERHLIHRDIKPGNILINRKGNVKISDFGVSGQLASTISSCVSWLGTITYMSPERILGKSYSVASDIWSFGLSLHELAIGVFPYKINTHHTQEAGFWELLDVIVDRDPPILPVVAFSPEFCSLVSICLDKNPANRPSAQQLLDHPFFATPDDPRALAQWVSERVGKAPL